MIGRTLSSASFFFDLPYQCATLVLVGFDRLPVDHLIELRTAVAGVVAFGAACVVLVKKRIGVVESRFGDRKTNRIVLANDFGEPDCGVDRVKLTIDIDLP